MHFFERASSITIWTKLLTSYWCGIMKRLPQKKAPQTSWWCFLWNHKALHIFQYPTVSTGRPPTKMVILLNYMGGDACCSCPQVALDASWSRLPLQHVTPGNKHPASWKNLFRAHRPLARDVFPDTCARNGPVTNPQPKNQCSRTPITACKRPCGNWVAEHLNCFTMRTRLLRLAGKTKWTHRKWLRSITHTRTRTAKNQCTAFNQYAITIKVNVHLEYLKKEHECLELTCSLLSFCAHAQYFRIAGPGNAQMLLSKRHRFNSTTLIPLFDFELFAFNKYGHTRCVFTCSGQVNNGIDHH